MGAPDGFRSIGFELASLGYAASRGFRDVLAPFELDPREFGVMRYVVAQEGQSQQALADLLQIPPSRMVAIVDSLEDRGLIERRPHATDRRVRELYVTGAGHALLKEASEEALSYERSLTATFTAAERKQMLSLLDRLAAELEIGRGAARFASRDELDDTTPTTDA